MRAPCMRYTARAYLKKIARLAEASSADQSRVLHRLHPIKDDCCVIERDALDRMERPSSRGRLQRFGLNLSPPAVHVHVNVQDAGQL